MASGRPILMMVSLGTLLLVTVFAIWLALRRPPLAPTADMDRATALNNRGVGLMEMYEYADAAAAFQQARTAAPDWTVAQVNYAIARMNMANEPDLDAAIEDFQDILKRDPRQPHANYCLGIIIKYRNQLAGAVGHFQAVVAVDDGDAGAWFHLGDCLLQVGDDRERAVQCLEKAYARNPYLRGPLWQLQSRLQADDPKRAQQMLKEFQELEAAEVLTDLATRYTCMGSKYAEVIGKSESGTADAAPPQVFRPADKFQVQLAAATAWAQAADFGSGPLGDLRRGIRQRFGATIIRLDFNQDDKIDLFLLGAVVEDGKVRDLLLKNDGNGRFVDVTTAAGLGGAHPSLGGCAADFDNDGHTDLFIAGAGAHKLFRNTGTGTFADVTQQAGFDKITSVCLAATWLDLEQDGDLDLLIGIFAENVVQAATQLTAGKNGAGGMLAYLNTGVALPVKEEHADPSLAVRFERREAFERAVKHDGPIVGLAVTDADGDRDLDILVLGDNTRPLVVLNDRLLRFHPVPVAAQPSGSAWNGALVLDIDHDERSDLLILAKEKPSLLINRTLPGAPGGPTHSFGATNSPPLRQAQAADVDLDGWMDVIGLSTDGKPVLLTNDRQGKLDYRPDAFGLDRDWPKDVVAVAMADFDGDGNPDLLTWAESGGLNLRTSRGNGNHTLKIALNGRRFGKKRPQLRTNRDGYGAFLAAQAGRLWTGLEATTLSAGLGQSSVPIELGLGKAAKPETLRLRWPDLVVQAEIDVPVGGVRRITQTGRKPDSCPVIFTWNGSKYVYITDCLGAGSVGEMLAGGGTRPPRPEESVKIDSEHLQMRDGRYVIKIAEPMDEIMYLDAARLVVVDHPNDLAVYPDERFAVADPPPTQALQFLRQRVEPVSARSSAGADVTQALRHWDRTTVDDFRSSLWLGMAEEHWVELDFGPTLRSIRPEDQLALCLAGWTQYAYPHTIFGLVQAGTPPISPVLEKQNAAGKWVPVVELGFPAGEPRMMTVDLTGKLAGYVGKLRIRTNMQVYWDQIFLAPLVEAGDAKVRITELPASSAMLGYRGFCQEVFPDGKLPAIYDHDQLANVAVSDWSGRLTRYGDVMELLKETDDRFVIGGPGDEVTVQFNAAGVPPLPAGWTRSFVLKTTGFCKDNAPFTATAGYVQPIPFRAMKQYPPEVEYPHPDDMKKWHTRRVGK